MRHTNSLKPFHQWTYPDGRLWASFFKESDGYRVEFPGLADFWISSDGTTINSKPAKGISADIVEHLRLNQTLPLALSRQGKLVLHGGAVEIDGHAVAFLGNSGRGKSTLVASFARQGYRFLTDDGLELTLANDQYLAQPSHPSIRLWDDSQSTLIPDGVTRVPELGYTTKSRLLAGDLIPHCNEARPINTAYFLGDRECSEFICEPVSSRNAIIELVGHSFLLDIDEREMLQNHFQQLSDLVRRVNFFHLNYPRSYNLLDSTCQSIIEHASHQLAP